MCLYHHPSCEWNKQHCSGVATLWLLTHMWESGVSFDRREEEVIRWCIYCPLWDLLFNFVFLLFALKPVKSSSVFLNWQTTKLFLWDWFCYFCFEVRLEHLDWDLISLKYRIWVFLMTIPQPVMVLVFLYVYQILSYQLELLVSIVTVSLMSEREIKQFYS